MAGRRDHHSPPLCSAGTRRRDVEMGGRLFYILAATSGHSTFDATHCGDGLAHGGDYEGGVTFSAIVGVSPFRGGLCLRRKTGIWRTAFTARSATEPQDRLKCGARVLEPQVHLQCGVCTLCLCLPAFGRRAQLPRCAPFGFLPGIEGCAK
jgi:hypothetical protein